MSSFENRSGVFTVQYRSAEDLSPENQKSLEAALRVASLDRPIGIVFVVAPDVKVIDPSVPAYWLGITGDPLVKIAAMAIVTPNPGVSIATRGFSVQNTLKDRVVQVKPFPDEPSAQAWVASVMKG